jgi:multicomponent Na+:H+ antiporter subunit E
MLRRALLAILLALLWMPLTGIISLESFGVGVVVSYLVLSLLFPESAPLPKNLRLLDRITASLQYILILCRDIVLSSLFVARRVIDPRIPINPGIIAVPVNDEGDSAETIAAVSAHGITITPGELVIDFDGQKVMYVHCLDVEVSAASAVENQAKRLKLLRRIFG